MSTNPDDIRADIEHTRADLGRDVDALAEKMNPSKAMERQTERVRDKFTGVKESIFGSPDYDERLDISGNSPQRGAVHDAKDKVGELAQDAGDAVQNAPREVRRATRGNPLAAGLIAMGAGWLISSLIPASRFERDAAETVKEKAEPVVEEVKGIAQEMGETLKPEAQQAAESVKDEAQAGFDNVKDEGQMQAEHVRDEGQRAVDNVRENDDHRGF